VNPTGTKKKIETSQVSRDEWHQANKDDIDPAKYAGESWFATDEYARPDDIDNPYTRGEVGKEEEYYPGPAPPRKLSKVAQRIKDKMQKEKDNRSLMQRLMDEGKI
jgi:hypothetical protein